MINWLSDVRAIVLRNIIRFRRNPDVLTWGVAQPVMFVLLFSQVFGGAITVPGTDYTKFLMAGIFVQTAVFGSTLSGMFMAEDKKKGLIDRFKTLPMAPSAVVVGRTIADLLLNAFTLSVMVLTGAIVGWRFEDGWLHFLAGMGLLLIFCWAFSWVMILLGLVVRSPEAMNSASFMVLFPLTFLSNAFVPSQSMPRFLRAFAEWNPVSALVQATRDLFGNTGDAPIPDTWPMQHPIAGVLAGTVIFTVVFAPLAVARYRKAA
ncbi:ABC transporter permease [Corynebacterium uberis]|uniref:ABC transporter permease n=1 Tax=Corynebacterium TaxID=1716 RepID=UPI001D0BACB2|nr:MULTISPECIES: ABC transporter permease [Corynebacterium]MCZ9308827.1 ABC transporter permease [Corynebacterium sp. c6VSa_13]UDL72645.1 ABC transporter permease [Corynebacterium uberis]UDL76479.1 ABC transporter permease [Corynebacterium uberis]UDL78691.1 ABC transporter permease [Corynebacterium uberis]UDL80970.1 ABC transporter permease [Corynebacterium uberis]